jgi:tetratricopeptide (TPR) repeat protein
MKKITAFTNGNKSDSNLRSGRCSMIYKSKPGFFLTCMIVFVCLSPSLCSCEKNDKDSSDEIEAGVLEAYELRMDGKADKADELLNDLLNKDSTSALACFELARTRHHLFLGSIPFSAEGWKEVTASSQKAVGFEPDNEIYAFYHAYATFFAAFLSTMMQNPDAGEKVTLACDAFQNVLNINPDCYDAMLYLVEIYAYLPEDIGGDRGKADQIASDLNQKDNISGAIAYARLLPDTANLVLYWQNIQKQTGSEARVLEELGRAYLLQSDTENGTKYYLDAIEADNTKRYLYMNLTRYLIMSAQQNTDTREEHLAKAGQLVNTYLQSGPELAPPLKAYAYGVLAVIKSLEGDNEAESANEVMAASIDPYYSKATGVPPEMLYCPPDEVKTQYISFFMPF